MDEYDSFVVRARSPHHARQLVATYNEEAAFYWLDTKRSSCRELKPNQDNEEIIIGSYNAG